MMRMDSTLHNNPTKIRLFSNSEMARGEIANLLVIRNFKLVIE
jgi:hypothetical protein